jgi:hypothetical protein
MKPAGILAALLPVAGGSIAWGLLYVNTYCEFAFLAWVVGAAIGLAAASVASRGLGTAIICGALALASIAAGKVCAMKWSAADSFAYYYLEDWLSFDSYRELAHDAIAFAKVDSEEEYPEFMTERRYSDSIQGAGVTEAEVAEFIKYDKEWLEWMYEYRPTYSEWRAEVEDGYAVDAQEAASHEASEMTIVEAAGYAIDHLALVDVFFAVVAAGASTSFGSGILLQSKRA